jgi:hypothetical protein
MPQMPSPYLALTPPIPTDPEEGLPAIPLSRRALPRVDPFAAFVPRPFVGPPSDLMMPPTAPAAMDGAGTQAPPATPAAGAPANLPALGSDYEALLKQLKERGDQLASEQRARGDTYRGMMDPLQKPNLQYDLTPLASLVDSWTGSHLQGGYKAPETGDERQAKIGKLREAADSAALQGSGTELEALKSLAQGTFNVDKFRADQAYREQTLANQRDQNDIARAKAAASGPSEGIKALDRAYAKDYNTYVLQGDAANAKTQIGSLEKARRLMDQTPNFSGPEVGSLPEAIRKRTSPGAYAIQQAIQESISSSLRSILGSAFTAKEGERIMNYAFDPALPPEENKYRVDKILGKLKAMASAKDQAMAYFQKNGTMAGYQASVPSSSDFDEIFKDERAPQSGESSGLPSPEEAAAELARRRGGK